MPKSYEMPKCDTATRQKLEKWSRRGSIENRLAFRAKVIMACLDGISMKDIATKFNIQTNTALKWRQRFSEYGLDGLVDTPRAGRPAIYGIELRNKILKLLEKKPPKGFSQWDGPRLAERLKCPAGAIWAILRKEGICLARRRSWCVSTDPQFSVKAADIVGLYLDPPQKAIVISVDEKPSMQALERRRGYVKASSGKIVRGYKSTYRRHGTLNLFAALEIATGIVRTGFTNRKRRVEFLEFMDETVAGFNPDQELHVILDNYGIHKKNDEWLKKHPNVHFHFTPTSASWLNMVEIWFGILERRVLRNGDFHSKEELKQAVQDFIDVWSENAHPFMWRKREVKGAQLKNTITNLKN